MNTLFFKYAVEVEKTRSITKAAEQLFMAQPNLSKAIRELEESMGFSIFERTSKGVFPTKRGVRFLEYAKNILNQLDRMEELSRPDHLDVQQFNISMPRGSYISDAITKFVSELDLQTSIDINVQETNSTQVIRNVAEGRFNLGIIRYETVYENYFLDYLKDKQLCHEPFWEFDYLALMSRDHPLSGKALVSPEDMSKDSIEIVHGDTSIPYLSSVAQQVDSPKPIKRKIVVYERANQFDLLSSVPQTYMWVSPIPQVTLERYNLVQKRCEKDALSPSKDLIIYKSGYEFTQLDKIFIDRLHDAKKNVLTNLDNS